MGGRRDFSGIVRPMHVTQLTLDRCPTCGSAIDHSKIFYDENAAIIIREGKVLKLSITMNRIFNLLWKAFPKGVANDKVKFEIFTAIGKEEPTHDSVSVTISWHRKGLREMGMEIDRVTIGDLYGRRLRFVYINKP
jgi:hypothetical protein